MLNWHKIKLAPNALRLSTVLRCGQSFRWKCIDDIWSIGLRNQIILLKQDGSDLQYASIPESEAAEELIYDYFQLNVDLDKLHEIWSQDLAFPKLARESGIRILRQDPFETLCSFICSSNNNIKRISKMVNQLCDNYGDKIGKFDGITYHSFPRPEQLAGKNTETELRNLGFGYRAKFLAHTAAAIAKFDDPDQYFAELRLAPYEQAHESLLAFKGVGPKVADCVCLMALDKFDCVPVDTHMYQVAKKDYKMKFGNNNAGYKSVQQAFKELWGSHAGWAQSIVFTKDLASLENGVTIVTEPVTIKDEPEMIKRELDDTISEAETMNEAKKMKTLK